ncbi:hypothetical protein ACFWNN_26750 [Lentzea sp. NPDC058450]|uniref:hypothetical protein n=1 Tax=Lentzea sp. NPDC058450 TaxID=3346505 RepID=UPI00364F09BD
MIISLERLTSLLDETLELVEAPPGCGAVLEGSIAEGFGNSSSDIDFLLLADDDHEHPTMPTIVFVQGRRVEVRTRSLRQVRAQLDAVPLYDLGTLPAALLDRCQRLLGAVVLRDNDIVRRARDFPLSLAEVVSGWYGRHSRQAMRHAVASHVLGQPEADGWAALAVRHAAKSWLAARGETYLEPKWLDRQFDRLIAGGHAEAAGLRDRLRAGGSVAERALLVADFGVAGCAADGREVAVGLRRGVTTWPIGDRLHVVRDRADVFVLGADAARVWRSIAPGRPLGEGAGGALGPAGGGTPGRLLAATSGDALAEFHRCGLIDLVWGGDGPIATAQPWAPAEPVTPPPSTRTPVLDLSGGAAPGHVARVLVPAERSAAGQVAPDPEPAEHSAAGQLALVPLPARRFAAAGMAQVWSNIMVENAREDLTGALDGGQLEVARTSGFRLLHHACRAVLSACGMNPLPPDAAIVARLASVVPADLAEQARAVDRALAGDDWETWGELLDKLVAGVREFVRADVFPASFDSAAAWEATLRIGHDWIRLGAYLDADFPVEEARDLLTSGGAQPHRRAG